MTPEDILKKLIEGAQSSEESKLIGAASLVTANRAKELSDASVFLAKTTQESAELLAKTTKESAEQVRKSNEVSVKRMELLTVAVITVGLIPAIIDIIHLFIK
ncbi:MAG: hypothetical protein Q7S28_03225 [bacterium]|nr:hypothetical protein [bacterium]